MTTIPATVEQGADQALESRHRIMWTTGDYPAIASQVIQDPGPLVVDAAGITDDDYVLDVASGAVNVSLPAARFGAQVVASDLTPQARRRPGARRRARRAARGPGRQSPEGRRHEMSVPAGHRDEGGGLRCTR
jgi:hypothetical protein